jgi:hypothetical protein
LLGIIVIAGIALTILANRKLNVVYEVEAAALAAGTRILQRNY